MHLRPLKIYFVLIVCFFSALSISQAETLFTYPQSLNLRIEGPWTRLLNRRYFAPEVAKAERIPVDIVIMNDLQPEVRIAAEVSLRGNTSLSPLECSFPKYKLHFTSEAVSGTLLAGVEQLGVGSHCSYRGGNSALYGRSYDGKSPHREALVYRLLEILGIPSFKTRPLLVKYIDTEITTGPINEVRWHQAFALESLKQFAERYELEMIDEQTASKVELADPGVTDMQRIARIALFNEMIGNNDWKLNLNELPSLRQNWNVYLAKNRSGQIEVVPYDFDLASVVARTDQKSSEPQNTLRKLPPVQVLVAKMVFAGQRARLMQEIESLKAVDSEGYQYFKAQFDAFFNAKLKP